MRPRELIVLLAALGLAAAAGVMLLSRESRAEALPPGPVTPGPVTLHDAPPALPNEPQAVPASHGATADDGAIVIADAVARPRRKEVDTTGWTHGIVRGDIELSVAAIDKIQSLTVIIEELRSGRRADGSFQSPYSARVPVSFDRASTPTFEVRDVPFSDYPFAVTVYSPGLNGGRRTITLNAEQPLVDDVVLSISCGTPFTLLVRDQDANPYPQLDVRLAPIGEPLGRPRLDAVTDGYGSAVWESVLTGDYQVLVMQNGQPLGETQTVTVLPGSRLYQNRIQGQGQTVTIPRGQPLEVRIADTRGYGVDGARVRVQATDRTRLTEFDAVSDASGRVLFPYLTPGTWQIDVTKDRFQTRARQITVVDRTPIAPVEIPLVRLR